LLLWAAWALPWTVVSVFGIACGILGVLHLATAIALLAGHRAAASLWKLASLWALILLLFISWQVFTGGAYLSGLYGSLGEGLFAALTAIWGLFVLVIVPTACWSLVRTRHASPRLGRMPWFGSAAAATVLLLGCAWFRAVGSIETADPETLDVVASELRWLVTDLPKGPSSKSRRGAAWKVTNIAAADCETPPEQAGTTLIASYAPAALDDGGYAISCVQADTPAAAVQRLKSVLVNGAAGPAIKLDAITSITRPLAGPTWTHAFALRPALDGLCVHDRCLLPWQLLARDAYIEFRPLDFIKDLAFGADVGALSANLRDDAGDAAADAPARRVTTRSWVLTELGATELSRMRPLDVDDSEEAIEQAMLQLERHIVAAQLKSGKFRYTLHPFSGKAQRRNFNLARQAGTLLVLCELGRSREAVDKTIRRGLDLLRKHTRGDATGKFVGLSKKKRPQTVRFGDTGLPLVAFVQCREHVGDVHDDLIGKLAALVLELQRPNGSFAPEFHLEQSRVIEGPEPLFTPGQAMLALALMETQLEKQTIAGWPSLEEVREARLRGMRYIAHHHWPASLYPYFFVEENWNCLAARASLELERVDAYERFCADYIRFKSRLILDEDSDVDPMFVGGYGFGNVIPPHNTGAAGFAEALSAAIAVKHARGEPTDAEDERLHLVMRFLLRQQWTKSNCFGCSRKALGAISEHTHSPVSRIDFAQHTWAALGHGRSALAL
jgi:hypothetical protein